MDEPDQPRLFGETPQPERVQSQQRRPLTADDIRAEMLSLIATLRRADAIPFEAAVMNKHVAMFPIMAQWLAADEGEQLLMEFMTEVERLKKAA